MKQFVKVEQVEGEGLEAFAQRTITLFCTNYIYTGTLVGVNDKYVKLENAAIVYETGPLNAKEWTLAESMPSPHYVMLSQIESFGPGK